MAGKCWDGGGKRGEEEQVKHKVEDDVITLNWQQNIFMLAGSFCFLQREANNFGVKNNKFIDFIALVMCEKEFIQRITRV